MLGNICRIFIYGGLGGLFASAAISCIMKVVHIILSVF